MVYSRLYLCTLASIFFTTITATNSLASGGSVSDRYSRICDNYIRNSIVSYAQLQTVVDTTQDLIPAGNPDGRITICLENSQVSQYNSAFGAASTLIIDPSRQRAAVKLLGMVGDGRVRSTIHSFAKSLEFRPGSNIFPAIQIRNNAKFEIEGVGFYINGNANYRNRVSAGMGVNNAETTISNVAFNIIGSQQASHTGLITYATLPNGSTLNIWNSNFFGSFSSDPGNQSCSKMGYAHIENTNVPYIAGLNVSTGGVGFNNGLAFVNSNVGLLSDIRSPNSNGRHNGSKVVHANASTFNLIQDLEINYLKGSSDRCSSQNSDAALVFENGSVVNLLQGTNQINVNAVHDPINNRFDTQNEASGVGILVDRSRIKRITHLDSHVAFGRAIEIRGSRPISTSGDVPRCEGYTDAECDQQFNPRESEIEQLENFIFTSHSDRADGLVIVDASVDSINGAQVRSYGFDGSAETANGIGSALIAYRSYIHELKNIDINVLTMDQDGSSNDTIRGIIDFDRSAVSFLTNAESRNIIVNGSLQVFAGMTSAQIDPFLDYRDAIRFANGSYAANISGQGGRQMYLKAGRRARGVKIDGESSVLRLINIDIETEGGIATNNPAANQPGLLILNGSEVYLIDYVNIVGSGTSATIYDSIVGYLYRSRFISTGNQAYSLSIISPNGSCATKRFANQSFAGACGVYQLFRSSAQAGQAANSIRGGRDLGATLTPLYNNPSLRREYIRVEMESTFGEL